MKWKRLLARMFALLLLTIPIVGVTWWQLRPPPVPEPLRIEQIQQLAELVTTKVRVSKRITHRVRGHLGELRVELYVEGDVLLGPSLDEARIELDVGARKARVYLPPPRRISSRVDLQRSRIERLDWIGAWWVFPSDDLRLRAETDSLRLSETAIRDGDGSPGEATAKAHAETVIAQLGRSAGWSTEVRWTE